MDTEQEDPAVAEAKRRRQMRMQAEELKVTVSMDEEEHKAHRQIVLRALMPTGCLCLPVLIPYAGAFLLLLVFPLVIMPWLGMCAYDISRHILKVESPGKRIFTSLGFTLILLAINVLAVYAILVMGQMVMRRLR